MNNLSSFFHQSSPPFLSLAAAAFVVRSSSCSSCCCCRHFSSSSSSWRPAGGKKKKRMSAQGRLGGGRTDYLLLLLLPSSTTPAAEHLQSAPALPAEGQHYLIRKVIAGRRVVLLLRVWQRVGRRLLLLLVYLPVRCDCADLLLSQLPLTGGCGKIRCIIITTSRAAAGTTTAVKVAHVRVADAPMFGNMKHTCPVISRPI